MTRRLARRLAGWIALLVATAQDSVVEKERAWALELAAVPETLAGQVTRTPRDAGTVASQPH